MLKQQDEIYADLSTQKTSATTSSHSRTSSRSSAKSDSAASNRDGVEDLEHLSAKELEKWEQYHTELGCLYPELIDKRLHRFRKETGELDLKKVEENRTI